MELSRTRPAVVSAQGKVISRHSPRTENKDSTNRANHQPTRQNRVQTSHISTILTFNYQRTHTPPHCILIVTSIPETRSHQPVTHTSGITLDSPQDAKVNLTHAGSMSRHFTLMHTRPLQTSPPGPPTTRPPSPPRTMINATSNDYLCHCLMNCSLLILL